LLLLLATAVTGVLSDTVGTCDDVCSASVDDMHVVITELVTLSPADDTLQQ